MSEPVPDWYKDHWLYKLALNDEQRDTAIALLRRYEAATAHDQWGKRENTAAIKQLAPEE